MVRFQRVQSFVLDGLLIFAPLFARQKCKARLLQEASALKREKAAHSPKMLPSDSPPVDAREIVGLKLLRQNLGEQVALPSGYLTYMGKQHK